MARLLQQGSRNNAREGQLYPPWQLKACSQEARRTCQFFWSGSRRTELQVGEGQLESWSARGVGGACGSWGLGWLHTSQAGAWAKPGVHRAAMQGEGSDKTEPLTCPRAAPKGCQQPQPTDLLWDHRPF